MSISSEETPIYSEELSRWRATHHGRLPGAVPTVEDVTSEVDVHMDEGAKKRTANRGAHGAVTRHRAKPRK